ncbi:Hsp90 co-chaperone Cdc37 [Malassezia pachydermatis]
MPGFNPAKQLDLEAFEKAFDYLSSHKELLRPDYGASDALLMQAFESQMAGQKSLARMCTEKALLIQYCNQLGRDGVSLFFQRYVTVVSNSSMMNTDGRAALVFLNDVLATYTRIASRADSMRDKFQEESGEGVEQIQLMSEDPNTVISFSIPDGPPPEHIKLEGEGTENLDVEQVREWLQQRWDIYSSFDDEFRRALESKSLEKVNEVLGRMPVSKAEVVVQDLDRAGILNFSSTEVRTAMTWSTYPTGSRRNKLNVSRHRLCSIHSSKYSHVIYTFTRGVAGVASYALPSIIPLRQH